MRHYNINGNSVPLKKPSNFALTLALDLLDSETEKTIHIGDTFDDLRGSQNIMRKNSTTPQNMITVGTTYGFEGGLKLKKGFETPNGTLHFDYLIDDPEELVEIVKQYL